MITRRGPKPSTVVEYDKIYIINMYVYRCLNANFRIREKYKKKLWKYIFILNILYFLGKMLYV